MFRSARCIRLVKADFCGRQAHHGITAVVGFNFAYNLGCVHGKNVDFVFLLTGHKNKSAIGGQGGACLSTQECPPYRAAP